MAQGNRPDRVAEEVRHVISEVLAREVKDPGIGFLTITSRRLPRSAINLGEASAIWLALDFKRREEKTDGAR